MYSSILLAVVAAGAAGVCVAGHTKGAAADHKPVAIQMRNVNFRIARDIILEVRTMRGTLIPVHAGEPVTFDDVSSFKVDIDTAEVALKPESLTSLMNSYTLAYPGAPIHDVSLTIENGKIIQKGKLHKGVELNFEIQGSLSATSDGNICMHADKISPEHIPVKGLLHFLGDDLSKLVKSNSARGMDVDGDNIILIPASLTPPPHMEGRVARVAIEDGKIVEYFDSGKHLPPLKPPLTTSGYIYHRGGVLRFGKLTMQDADLEIVGDRGKVFDFFQKEYLKQLVAGYSKSTANKGLIAHMVDYSHFDHASRGSAARTVTGK